jgi:protein Tob/BTG
VNVEENNYCKFQSPSTETTKQWKPKSFHTMRIEVHSAADFLMNLLRVRQVSSLSESQLLTFKGSLQDVLLQRYRSHWYPASPTKGSGFRCIRINGKMDPIIEQAGSAVGLNSRQLRKMFPQELTIWIDPLEVSYRIGENGSICVLYDHAHRASPSSDLDSTGSGVNSEDYAIERSRFEITPDLNKLVMDFFEKSNSTVITKPKVHYNRNRNNHSQHYNSNHNSNNHHHQQPHQQHHQQQYNPYTNNNNLSLGSHGLSPPLSPQQQQQSVTNFHQQPPQHNNRYPHHHFSSPPNNKFINNDHQYYNNWDYHHHNKVRTQC